jgi:hypothetical protein
MSTSWGTMISLHLHTVTQLFPLPADCFERATSLVFMLVTSAVLWINLHFLNPYKLKAYFLREIIKFTFSNKRLFKHYSHLQNRILLLVSSAPSNSKADYPQRWRRKWKWNCNWSKLNSPISLQRKRDCGNLKVACGWAGHFKYNWANLMLSLTGR